MIALIDLYRKTLLKVNGFAVSTVDTYTINIKAFCTFAKTQLNSDPVQITGPHLQMDFVSEKHGHRIQSN